eukprot:Awhi_evm2s4258
MLKTILIFARFRDTTYQSQSRVHVHVKMAIKTILVVFARFSDTTYQSESRVH